MKMKYLAIIGLSVVLFSMLPDASFAEVKLPSYATGSAESKATSIGKKITDFLSLGVGILAIIAMLVGAGYMPFNRDRAWQFMIGGIVALVIAGMVYGIAKVVT